jgi:hypothetical protein
MLLPPRRSAVIGRRSTASRTRPVRPVFDHLAALTDEVGLFEHALYAAPRPEHGYCLDDAARALVVTCRESTSGPLLARLRDCYLTFVLAAVCEDGSCHNRMDITGRWSDSPGLGDWWGRAVWGLGMAAARSPLPDERARALMGFRVVAQRRAADSRSMVFACLGAGEILRARPGEQAARQLARDAISVIDTSRPDRDWPWPEPRLRYANAAVAEALLIGGEVLADRAVAARGLELLAFLLRVEIRDRHLSVTPVGGRGPGDLGPGFDQQPIEVAAIAGACGTAYRLTNDPRWLIGTSLAWRWFLGDNDSGTPMFDPVTGAGYDGLQADGPNLNQGAESTLALLSTVQDVRRAHELR